MRHLIARFLYDAGHATKKRAEVLTSQIRVLLSKRASNLIQQGLRMDEKIACPMCQEKVTRIELENNNRLKHPFNGCYACYFDKE